MLSNPKMETHCLISLEEKGLCEDLLFSFYRIVCPTEVDPRWTASIWNIMSKVRVEGVMWGAGTALGELPPYFMARAARLSGYDPEDEDDLAAFEELQRKKNNPELLVSRLHSFSVPDRPMDDANINICSRVHWID